MCCLLFLADVDFLTTVPVVEFQSFQQRQFVPVMILDDQIVEGDEQFIAFLNPPTLRGVRLNTDPAIISILENDCEHMYTTLLAHFAHTSSHILTHTHSVLKLVRLNLRKV